MVSVLVLSGIDARAPAIGTSVAAWVRRLCPLAEIARNGLRSHVGVNRGADGVGLQAGHNGAAALLVLAGVEVGPSVGHFCAGQVNRVS